MSNITPPVQGQLNSEGEPNSNVKKQKISKLPAYLSLITLILIAIPAMLMVFPSKTSPAALPPDQFSSERAMQHLPIIASQPHPSGSAAQAKVTEYLLETLRTCGLEPELQKTSGAENVIARLTGTKSTGAIVILAHYDSVSESPGAGDNGSGTSVLLEVARALTAAPPFQNDVIFLFDDSEELPGAFTGSIAFVREHPWMTSFSGGGGYDTTPFRDVGTMVLALEDNYPYKEKHTAMDVPKIVSEQSVHQMGEQTLAITKELASLDLSRQSTTQETFFAVPLLGFFHYPQNWAPVLALLALILWLLSVILTRKKRLITLKGLLLASFTILMSAGLTALFIAALRPMLPEIFNWDVSKWPDWPEVIPPSSLYAFLFFAVMTLAIALASYKLSRRWCAPTEVALSSLMPFLLVGLASSFSSPKGAYLFTWPVLIGSAVWLLAAAIPSFRKLPHELPSVLAAVPMILFVLPFIPGIVMGDGTKSLPILGAVLALLVSSALPSLDQLLVKRQIEKGV